MSHLLYHCFSRSRSGEIKPALDILKGIIQKGILLVREDPEVQWRDPCGGWRSLQITQYRFCLTSLNNDDDLRNHCKIFGPIGIGFKTEFIRGLGGFPVFYLPAPTGTDEEDSEDRLGVSLVYRLAELRTVMENIRTLPLKYRSNVYRDVQDVGELEGAVRFLGNILYFTDYTHQNDTIALRYYRQREWRVIAGLTSEPVRIKYYTNSSYYVLSEYNGVPIHRFIEDVVVFGTEQDATDLDNILRNNNILVRPRLIRQ